MKVILKNDLDLIQKKENFKQKSYIIIQFFIGYLPNTHTQMHNFFEYILNTHTQNCVFGRLDTISHRIPNNIFSNKFRLFLKFPTMYYKTSYFEINE